MKLGSPYDQDKLCSLLLIKSRQKYSIYQEIDKTPIEERQHGFFVSAKPINNHCRGCLELRDGDLFVRVFFWISDLHQMIDNESGRELILATDRNLKKTLLEAVIYYTPKTKYFRFDMFDEEGVSLIKFTSLEESVFSLYYKFIVAAIKRLVLPDVDTHPEYEYYSTFFKDGTAGDFEKVMGAKLSDAIIEMRMLMEPI